MLRDENTVKQELLNYRNKVILLRNELSEIERDFAFQHYGVKIGSVVVVDDHEYLVTSLRYIWRHTRPSLMARKKIMGGGWSKHKKHVDGSWELLKDG